MLSIPNLFTLMRLLLAPAVIWAILAGDHRFALLVFVLAGATDGIDGFLARRFGWITALGAVLDPIADKTLLSGVYVALAVAGLMPWWFVALVFARDLFILAGAAVLFRSAGIREFPPSVWGKVSTALQILTAALWMGRNAFPSNPVAPVAAPLLWAAAAATAWSGIHYGWLGTRMLGRGRPDHRTSPTSPTGPR